MDTQELEKLYSLKEKGIITEEQFNIKKQQILKSDKNEINSNIFKYVFCLLYVLSFLSIWIIIVISPFIFNYALKINAFNTDWGIRGIVIISIPLFISCVVCGLLSKFIYNKISMKAENEKFVRKYKIFNKVMLIFTIIIAAIFIVTDIYYYRKNNGITTEYYKNGQIKSEKQYKEGECFGIIKTYDEIGRKTETPCDGSYTKKYYSTGQLEQEYDGKSIKQYNLDNQLVREEFCSANSEVTESKHGRMECGSDNINEYEYYPNGKLKTETTNEHRLGIRYLNDSFLVIEEVNALCSNTGEIIAASSKSRTLFYQAERLCREYAKKIK